MPGETLANLDISFIDQSTGRHYLADRSNKSIDIFDTKNDVYVGRVGTFVGAIMKNGKIRHSVTTSEATGQVFVPVGAVGGGDGTIHVVAPRS